MFKDGEEKTVEQAISNIIDAVDMANYSEEMEVIRGAISGNPHNEDTVWKDRYNTLYEQYTKRFKETFAEPMGDPNRLDPDVHNTDTTFTEKDILRFDFSGKNE